MFVVDFNPIGVKVTYLRRPKGGIEMPKETKFDAVKLREFVTDGKTAQQIQDAFGINKNTLKAHLMKLMQLDEKFYKIDGMEGRSVSGNIKFSKTGLRLSETLLTNYGFKAGDTFKFSCTDDGKIILEKN